MSKKVYWTTKDGSKIDVDEMSVEHLRNTLKRIIRNAENRDTYDKFKKYKNERIKDLQNDEPYAFDYLWK